MTLSESSAKSLDFIRTKVEKQFYDLNILEKAALKEVYEEIQLQVTGKKVTLDTSCSGCVTGAVNICFNFIKFHEVKKPSKPEKPLTPANVDRVSTNDSLSLTDQIKFKGNTLVTFSESKGTSIEVINIPKEDYTKLSLPQLRALFPTIKDTSKEGFIEKILKHEKTLK